VVEQTVQEATRAKKAAIKNWFNPKNADDYKYYKKLKAAAKTAVAMAKKAHFDELYDELETPKGAKEISPLAATRHVAIQDIGLAKNIRAVDGHLLTSPTEILDRWYEFFQGVSNVEFPHPPNTSAEPTLGPAPPITSKEVTEALRKMKNTKAPGPDEVLAEV